MLNVTKNSIPSPCMRPIPYFQLSLCDEALKELSNPGASGSIFYLYPISSFPYVMRHWRNYLTPVPVAVYFTLHKTMSLSLRRCNIKRQNSYRSYCLAITWYVLWKYYRSYCRAITWYVFWKYYRSYCRAITWYVFWKYYRSYCRAITWYVFWKYYRSYCRAITWYVFWKYYRSYCRAITWYVLWKYYRSYCRAITWYVFWKYWRQTYCLSQLLHKLKCINWNKALTCSLPQNTGELLNKKQVKQLG